MQQILALKPNLALVDFEQNTVLHLAVWRKIEIFKRLLNSDNIKSLLKMENNKQQNPIELICLACQKDHLIHLMKMGLTARMLTIVPTFAKNFLANVDDINIVPFTDADFHYLDFKLIKSGGCPLHWCSRTENIQQYLKYFNIETPNIYGESPLMTMIKQENFYCSLYYMYFGASVNHPDSNGNYPLHIAVLKANVPLIKALIIFDSNVNLKNANGINAMQLASGQDPIAYKEINQLFETYHQVRKKVIKVMKIFFNF